MKLPRIPASTTLPHRTKKSGLVPFALLTCLAWAAFLPMASAVVNPVVTSNRTTGVAPLYVFLDATSSTASGIAQPMHDLYYRWDFGDPDSGSWFDGMSRNTATGPVAAHVFETSGTYTVSLTVSDGNGGVGSTTVQIVVGDPNVVYSGTNTICFSQTSDFTGAPAGAQQITTSNFSSIQGHVATGKRLLLHRDQTWNVSTTLEIDPAGPGTVGAFGTGAAPILRMAADTYPTLEPASSDWRLMDLEIDGASYATTRGINTGNGVTQLLCLRLNIHHVHGGIYALSNGLGVVDSTLEHAIGGGGGNLGFIQAQQFAVLGCVWNDSTQAEHVLRVPFCDRGVIGHNVMGMQADTKHVLKLHAPQWGSSGTYSQKIVISDNTFTGNSAWTVAVGPENSSYDERVRDVIVERNFFHDNNSKVQQSLEIWSQEVTVRNNIFNRTNGPGRMALEIGQRGVEPPPLNCRAFNNTVYAGNAAATLVYVAPEASNTTVRNNLSTSPTGTSVVVSGGGSGLVSDHNLATNTPGFVVANPANPIDFALAAGSAAIDSGTPVPVFDDYLSLSRPVGAYDAGAYEYYPLNHAPSFTADPLVKPAATVGIAYSGSIAPDASDPDTSDTLTFSKQGGPAWLSVAAGGVLSGTPLSTDVGLSTFTVRVTDRGGLSGDATLDIPVVAAPKPPAPAAHSWTVY